MFKAVGTGNERLNAEIVEWISRNYPEVITAYRKAMTTEDEFPPNEGLNGRMPVKL